MQQTNFKVEILIFDDASNDKAQTIIKKIAAANDTIKLFLQNENQWSKNRYGLMDWLFPAAKGKYIALCEGDDYWIDPLKLQKQVDFMEANPDYSGIGTNAEVRYEYSVREKHLFKNYPTTTFDINNFLESRPFHTATFMFRKAAYKNDFPTAILSADRALYMLMSCFGKIYYLEDVTAVYRRNEKGLSRNVTSKLMKKDYAIAKYIQKYNANFEYYRLQAFVAYTIFAYSHNIYLKDFLKNSVLLVYYRLKREDNTSIKSVLYSSYKLISKSYKKVQSI
jgi:glycosyltransferase involved in cell wall biosynthesis|tara:strand:- start:299691 stop:300530 length:840 start_codon:yes stop_codon:yes gene_type:complete